MYTQTLTQGCIRAELKIAQSQPPHRITLNKAVGETRTQACSHFIDQICYSRPRHQINVTFDSERRVVTIVIRRSRVHDDYWLDMYGLYSDEALIRDFGWDQYVSYKQHVEEYGKTFRWIRPKRTFPHPEIEQVQERSFSANEYLPTDINLDYKTI